MDPRQRGPGWRLVRVECHLLAGEVDEARQALAGFASSHDELHARRACQEAVLAALAGDEAGRDAALARAEALEARAAPGDQDLARRLVPWRTAAETRRALERGWPPPGGLPYHPPAE
ncbi:MAG: hypothetical protein M9894_18105 [Planctomycetes bacterium]|nr:hypothetical protein [Planctomycetota bacterium]